MQWFHDGRERLEKRPDQLYTNDLRNGIHI